jgi:TetR/AcrR family transcriptional regulator of autoinduction and epiphytic fitness
MDGRARRSATTRRLVAEAYLDLVREGNLRPTAREIAEKANVSERGVFRHYRDMETLLAEAARLQIETVATLVPPRRRPSGPLAERLHAYTARWCDLNERVSPVRRAALLTEPFSEVVASRLVWVRTIQREELAAAVETEFATLPEPLREATLGALLAASNWEAWNELRKRQGIDADIARRAMTELLVAAVERATASPRKRRPDST